MKDSSVYKVGCSKDADVKCEITYWKSPPGKIVLKDQELHLWRFNLDSSEHELSRLLSLLAPDEMVRANRLLDVQKKNQFIVSRARLRQVLGFYQKVDPYQITFQYNAHGKPELAESLHPLLSFNLSHSGDWGVLAVVSSFAVGIDIEKIESELDYAQLTSRYFDEREKMQLSQYSPLRQRRGFYRLWTQKEAVLKLEGVGFQTKPPPAENVKAERAVRVFPIAPGFICSVATQKACKKINRFNFPALSHC